ncbi:MAG: hypothetical protein HYW49_13220 [Deltaproteobacteria bacterium]|nr:hypothetical protein [Deltaproteobacteria bacterium]
MKLKLAENSDVTILNVLENVDIHSLAVLKAGIAKLLQSGKKKVAINLTEATQLTGPIIRDILQFDQLSGANGGTIVIVGQAPMVNATLKIVGKLTTTRCFENVDDAVAWFANPATADVAPAKAAPPPPPPEPEPEEPPLQVDPNDPLAQLKITHHKLEARNKTLKKKLGGVNKEMIAKFRAENSLLQKHLIAMNGQLRLLMKDRKKPLDRASFAGKLKQLEVALAEFLCEAGLIAKGKGASAGTVEAD